MSHAGHDHVAVPARGGAARRALWIALLANGGFLVVEVAGGFLFDSLALLADAAHMASDVVGLAIALVAQSLTARPSSSRRTFGFRRAEALGALANAVLIFVAAVWIFVEASDRISDPPEVAGGGLLAVATIGLLVNVASAVILARVAGRNLNLRGALVHMVADAAASVGAIAAGVGVLAFDANWLDPVISFVIGLLIVWSVWGLLRDTTHVLLEGVPRDLDLDAVTDSLATAPGVEAVHHLHVWEVASDLPALSAHIVLTGEPTLHEAQARGDELKVLLAERFGIQHATLELECHECEAPDHDGAG